MKSIYRLKVSFMNREPQEIEVVAKDNLEAMINVINSLPYGDRGQVISVKITYIKD